MRTWWPSPDLRQTTRPASGLSVLPEGTSNSRFHVPAPRATAGEGTTRRACMRLVGRIGLRHVAGAAAISLAALAMGATPAVAADATVTVVHGIPATPVDVYVDGAAAIPNFQYETVTTTSLPGRRAHPRDPARRSRSGQLPDPLGQRRPGVGWQLLGGRASDRGGTARPEPLPEPDLPDARGPGRRHRAAHRSCSRRGCSGGRSDQCSRSHQPQEASLFVPAGTVSADVVLAGTSTVAIGPASLNLAAGTGTSCTPSVMLTLDTRCSRRRTRSAPAPRLRHIRCPRATAAARVRFRGGLSPSWVSD